MVGGGGPKNFFGAPHRTAILMDNTAELTAGALRSDPQGSLESAKALIAAGGWDPYNVTEDADLGIRLHRLGYRVEILDSTTYEEANSDFVNWIKQRSRWHKGYLQTWMVHMRRPRHGCRPSPCCPTTST